MDYNNKKNSVFLRKKITGENSIEENVKNLVEGISSTKIFVFPAYFHSIKGIIKNISYSKKNEGVINHVYQYSGAFLCIFLKNTIITYHDVFTMLEGKNILARYINIFLNILLPCFFAKKLICISEYTKKELLLYCPKFAIKKVEVIYNMNRKGIEHSEHVFNSEMPVILHIGTAERKNLMRVIDAITDISCELIIVGILSDNQKELLEKNKINYIHYFDVPYSKILELYNYCDIVSFPTLAEGFGQIVIEAQKVGRCVVSSNIAIIKEIGGDGYIEVNPYDVGSIKNGFLSIIHNEPLRNKIISNGLKNVKRFDSELFIGSYKKLYDSLLNTP